MRLSRAAHTWNFESSTSVSPFDSRSLNHRGKFVNYPYFCVYLPTSPAVPVDAFFSPDPPHFFPEVQGVMLPPFSVHPSPMSILLWSISCFVIGSTCHTADCILEARCPCALCKPSPLIPDRPRPDVDISVYAPSPFLCCAFRQSAILHGVTIGDVD